MTGPDVAAENRRLRIMRWLNEQGADSNSTCTLEQTPLFEAARDGCTDAVRMFVEEDAAMNLRDSVGRRALDWAIIQVAYGTDTYCLNDERGGRTGVEAVVTYLMERGCEQSDMSDGVVHEIITGFTNLSMDPTQ
jgi:hypothetical protein